MSNFLFRMSRLRNSANRIKSGENQAKSVSFAVRSILFSIFGFAFLFAGLWLLFAGDGGEKVVFVIGGFIGFICAVPLYVNAGIRIGFQLSINRNWSGWIALAVLIASIAAAIIVTVAKLG